MVSKRWAAFIAKWSRSTASTRLALMISAIKGVGVGPCGIALEACSSVAERCHYMAEGGGSIPSAPKCFIRSLYGLSLRGHRWIVGEMRLVWIFGVIGAFWRR